MGCCHLRRRLFLGKSVPSSQELNRGSPEAKPLPPNHFPAFSFRGCPSLGSLREARGAPTQGPKGVSAAPGDPRGPSQASPAHVPRALRRPPFRSSAAAVYSQPKPAERRPSA